jgi:hypothetical protein
MIEWWSTALLSNMANSWLFNRSQFDLRC